MISAIEIADALKIHRPTPEQIDVIERAPIDAPASVIAGAGSGKTELMSARVLWLVANRIMKPSEVLGLTFTRKAAKELQLRVGNRLNTLRETSFWPAELGHDFDPPKIATYNSFANEVFRSVSLAIGFESDVPLLGEAGTFLLAKKFVEGSAYALVPNIAESDRRADSLVELVISLESELGEHRISAHQLENFVKEFAGFVEQLPQKPGASDSSPLGYTTEMMAPLLETVDVARLAEGFREYKRAAATVDYSDQLRLAADAISAQPELIESYRDQFRQVLLDEYQDTSSVQVRLLASIFHSRAVLAVGDPNQSIYGWRGAAAGTMESFGQRFGAHPRDVFPLSSNWRSDRKILEVANAVAQSLAASSHQLTATPLVLTAPEDRPAGEVVVEVFEHEQLEAERVAAFFRDKLSNDISMAILFRKRKHMARYAAALERHGVPYEISGLGGLLQIPEVADLVAALRVIADPEAGAALMRLLTGPRWRVGPADLAELHAYAKKLSKVRGEQGAPWPVTIVEALDELAQTNPFMAPDLSEVSRERLKDAARLLRVLRKQVNLSLTEFARAVTAELLLDIELMASGRNEPMSNLYSFYDLIGDFENTATEPNLAGFLNWLDHAERKQRLEPPKNGVKKGLVQLLTVHSSKGLEWDVVAVPDLVEGEFPSEERSYRGWMSAGKLPYPLRSDANALPEFEWATAADQRELKMRFGAFKGAVKDHLFAEQSRLAYVAITRAKHSLLMTGSYWSSGSDKPRAISRYLELILPTLNKANEISTATALLDNPYPQANDSLTWPANLGSEIDVERQELGEILLSQLKAPDLLEVAAVADELVRLRSVSEIHFPTRLSATALAAFLLEPNDFVKRLARPMPSEYIAAAALGTQFHSAVEDWFLLGENQEPQALEEFSLIGENAAQLAVNFQGSEFADRTPVNIELPIQFVLDDLVVICKLDAVFTTEAGVELVDWKTGSPQQLEKMRLQLSLYRLALSKFTNLPFESVTASLYFAASNETIRLEQLFSEDELVEMIREAKKALQAP